MKKEILKNYIWNQLNTRIFYELNNNMNNLDLRKKFKEDTGIVLTLSNYNLGRIKSSVKANLKGK